jgi:hypothetical protein
VKHENLIGFVGGAGTQLTPLTYTMKYLKMVGALTPLILLRFEPQRFAELLKKSAREIVGLEHYSIASFDTP